MKASLIIAIIYLLGSFVAYKYIKYLILKNNSHNEWTVGDRFFTLILSILSWFVVICIFSLVTINYITLSKKSEW